MAGLDLSLTAIDELLAKKSSDWYAVTAIGALSEGAGIYSRSTLENGDIIVLKRRGQDGREWVLHMIVGLHITLDQLYPDSWGDWRWEKPPTPSPSYVEWLEDELMPRLS